MTKIEKEFQSAKTMSEVFIIANTLKSLGYDEAEVNVAMSQRRRSLMLREQNTLRKVLPKRVFRYNPEHQPISYLVVQDLGSKEGKLTIEPGGEFVWS